MLIALQDITFEFGARTIIKDSSLHIIPGDRIGLIGLNGTGKSTLLRIINGEYSISKGSVNKIRNLSLGFFNQDLLSFETDDNILNVGMTAFSEALKVEKELEELTAQLEHSQDEAILHAYSDKLHEFDILDGYNIRHKTATVLEGLGFTTADLERPYNQFSGGWRMRVLLARIILQKPDVLMLDEPTNHLDLPSIEWLEKYLSNYDGAVIIVSHDRYFLDRMVNKIVEVYQQELHHYAGNYSDYEEEKILRRELQQRAFENQQDYIKQQEKFIERFKAKASKAAQAQSIAKRLDKIERIEQTDSGPSKIRMNFTVNKMPGKILTTLENVSKSFGDLTILKNTSAEINRGDKIALIGANGKGKSTLLRVIAGTETFEGNRVPGHNLVTSFYAQHQLEALHMDNEILEELKSVGSGRSEVELRTLLGCFLFQGDDVFKKVRILSGGEKARVALGKVIIGQANFLLLDEPTNHLDINSVEMLIDALGKYEGSLVLVSHDRYFVSKTANKIWEIIDGEIKEFKGNYAEWEEWKKRQALAAAPAKAEKKNAPVAQPVQPTNPAPQKSSIDKDLKREFQKQQKLSQQLEEQITTLKDRVKQLEADMANPDVYGDKQKFRNTEDAYKKANADLIKANGEYEEVFEKVMELEEKMNG